MSNTQNMSPQGYNIQQNPYNENPFWEHETGEVAATVDVGTVRTQTLGSGIPASVSVTNSGDQENAVFDFEFNIPAGPKGETGATGSQGPRGFEGPVGPQGPRGLTGSRGEKGEKGDTGEQGPAGENGKTPRITVLASVLPIGGQPGVSVTSSGTDETPDYNFTFWGLKGEKGDRGVGGFERKEVEETIKGWYDNEGNIKYYNILIGDANYNYTKLPLSFNEFYNVNIVPYVENDNLYFLEINKIEDNYLKLDAIYTQTGDFPESYSNIGWMELDIPPVYNNTNKEVIWIETKDSSTYWNQMPVMRKVITNFSTNDMETPTPFKYDVKTGTCTADFNGTSVTFNFSLSLENILSLTSTYIYLKMCVPEEKEEGIINSFRTKDFSGDDYLISPILNFTTDNPNITVEVIQAKIKLVHSGGIDLKDISVTLIYGGETIMLNTTDLFNTDEVDFYSQSQEVTTDEEKYYVLSTIDKS